MSNPIDQKASIALPSGFVFGQVEPTTPRSVNKLSIASLPEAVVEPSLGPLAQFLGQFVGRGFNTIFRPDNSVTPTQFPTPVGPGNPRDNVLELNLTEESLTFSPALGSVPNRGANAQGDLTLNGVPYLQAVNDVTTPGKSVGIHAEPGLWMAVPSSSTPSLPTTVTRMASIPHGTTINAQGTASPPTPGKPTIPPVSITPFTIQGNSPISFQSQNVAIQNTPRIPQDLTSFIANGSITQAMLDDPNSVLRSHIAHQNIVSTIVINIATTPPPPLFAGGAANIAFLVGDPTQTQAKENANVVRMAATFWVETVEYILHIPVHRKDGRPLLVQGEGGPLGVPAPTFHVVLSEDVTEPITITANSTQIQYSQLVLLNFSTLSWPHVSVATLVPANPVLIAPQLPPKKL